ADALMRLAELLANGPPGISAAEIERVLVDRERLQSTGVGGGVAIPHGSIDRLERQVGAGLLCPSGIHLDAIANASVKSLCGVIGPKRAPGEHLKTLARVSRLLRDQPFRERLLDAPDGRSAYALLAAEEGRAVAS